MHASLLPLLLSPLLLALSQALPIPPPLSPPPPPPPPSSSATSLHAAIAQYAAAAAAANRQSTARFQADLANLPAWAAQHANVEALSRWTAARLTDTMYQGPHFVPGVAHAVRQFVTAVPVALRKASEVLTSPGIVAGTLRLTNWKNKTVERALDAGVLARYRHPALDHERQALRERYLAEVVRHPERNVWWTPILSEKERTVLYR